MKKLFQNIDEAKSFTITTFFVSVIISIISVNYFFTRDYNYLLNQVKKNLTNFSDQKENIVSQFLYDKGLGIYFSQNYGSVMDVIEINDGTKEIDMNGLRKLLYVERQQKMRLNTYLVNNKGALLTANEDFDKSADRVTTKIIRNELLDKCLNEKNSEENFYTGIDEGNRSVFGTYKKVNALVPLCLFSETEKVTNIDVPASQILRRYIYFGLFFVVIMTFLSGFLACFKSPFTLEEVFLVILCGAASISYTFIVSLLTRGIDYFSLDTHLLEITMATFSFSILIFTQSVKDYKFLKIGALLLGIYFLLVIFFEEYRQAYEMTSVARNLILVLMRSLSITGFLFLFFNFKKNGKFK